MVKEKKVEKYEMILRYTCPVTGNQAEASGADLYFNGNEQECEVCGSHGVVYVDVKCFHCGKHHEVELNSW